MMHRQQGAIGIQPRTAAENQLLETLRSNVELALDVEAFARHQVNVARDERWPLEHGARPTEEGRAKALETNRVLHRLRAAISAPGTKPGSDAKLGLVDLIGRNFIIARELEGAAANRRRDARNRLELLEAGHPVLPDDEAKAERAQRDLQALHLICVEARSARTVAA